MQCRQEGPTSSKETVCILLFALCLPGRLIVHYWCMLVDDLRPTLLCALAAVNNYVNWKLIGGKWLHTTCSIVSHVVSQAILFLFNFQKCCLQYLHIAEHCCSILYDVLYCIVLYCVLNCTVLLLAVPVCIVFYFSLYFC